VAWAFVQGGQPAATTGTGLALSFTYGSNVTAPNRLILKVELNELSNPAGTLIGVTDTGTATLGTWIKATEADSTASSYALRAETWTAVVLASGTCTVTIKGSNAANIWQIALAATEYSGLSTANDNTCIDVSAIAVWLTANPFQIASPATHYPNELASVGYFDDGQVRAITAGSGFVMREFTGSSGTCEAAEEDKDSGATGSVITGTWTGAFQGGSCCDIVIFKLPTFPPPPKMHNQAVNRAASF
jgi:hypothetical protein